MSDNSDIGNTENEEKIDETPILKPKAKRKMSENQMKNLEVGRLRRKEKIEEKKESLKMEYAKKLYESSLGALDPQTSKEDIKNKLPKPDAFGQDNPTQTKSKSKSKPKPSQVSDEESSSEEEEVVIRSKQSTKKKKKRKVIIELSSSDDDTDEEEETEAEPKPSRKMVSQQNKKSVIKVTEPIKKNYFAD
jgi:hypothetical protein